MNVKPTYEELERRVRELESLLSGTSGEYHLPDNAISGLADIVDMQAIQSLMNHFYTLTNIGVAILDLKGNILVATGWQDICTRFHRVHPETCKNCLESDLILSNGIEPGTFKLYRCKNHMWDMATPIMAGSVKVGNLFLGQFLFKDEVPDINTFRDHAGRYGFDETQYLAALEKVPRWTRETVNEVMGFYTKLANLISDLGYRNLMLNRSEELLSRSQELAQIGSWELELSGNHLTWTDEVYRIFGCEPQEFAATYEAFLDAVHPEDRSTLEEVYSRSLREGSGGYEIEYRIIRWDSGEIRYVHERCVHERDAAGTVIQSIGMVQDITERKRTEIALKESEQFLQILLESIPLPVFYKDVEGRYKGFNKAFETFFGRPKSELLGCSVFDINPPELARIYHAKDSELFKKISTQIFESQVKNAYGELRDVVFHKSSLTNSSGAITGLVGAIMDVTERKQAEESLRNSENRLCSFMNQIQGTAWLTDRELRFQLSRGAGLAQLGLNPDQVVGLSLQEFFGIDDEDHIVISHHRRALRGESIKYEQVYNDIIFESRLTPMLDEQGRIAGVIGFSVDITARKQAEEALKASEAWLGETSRIARVGGWKIDLLGNTLEWTDETFRIHELPIGDPPNVAEAILFYHEEDRPRVSTAVQHAIETGESFDFEARVITEKQNLIWVRSIGHAIFDEGRLVVVWGMIQDITERKQVEESLRENENILNVTGQMAKIGGWALYPETMEVTWTDETYRIHEMPKSIKPPLEDAIKFWHPEDQPILRKAIQQALDNGTPYDLELRFITAKGRNLYARTKCNPILHNGKVIKLQGFFQDITEKKQAEAEKEKLQAQLAQAQKMESVGRLAGGVAHDFNNMLNIILGNTEMAMEDMAPDHPLQDSLGEIFSAAKRSADITRQLLAFSRKQTIAPKVIDLNATIESMLRMLRRLIGEDIDLAWLPGTNIRQVRMDPSQIDQIMANLCVNARDAIADVGKITIETGDTTFDSAYCATHPGFEAGDFVLLAVSDDGCGMDQEALASLFEPFFSTKDVGKGTGLGLATVYGIVKQNNGFINVYSEPDQGTTFRIYLPQYRAEIESPKKKTADKIDMNGNETILLVEDEPSILRMTRMMLERNGYKVLAAGTPGEAISLAHEHAGQIHLLMTDVVMPEMNGRDLAKNLLSLYPNLKRLFMSGYTANVIAHHGVLDEGVQFIQKPFSKKNLAIKVREALDEDNP